MAQYEIQPNRYYTAWEVRTDPMTVVFTGTALECIAWCEAQGAIRRGPRLYTTKVA